MIPIAIGKGGNPHDSVNTGPLVVRLTEEKVKFINKNLSVRGAEKLAKTKTDAKSVFKTRKKGSDPRIKHLEDELISALGTKVKLTYQKGSGKIIVNYFSDDDFERIFSLLTGNKNS